MNRSFERKNLKDIKRIIIKVGSRVLASPSSGLNLEAFASITRQISSLIEKEKEVILVTSGAIAAGMRKMGLKIRPRTIPEQQAAAAAGQS
ncbi:MAG: glutamate 5-kinase, partial [Deltaproteobacteria bacterium]